MADISSQQIEALIEVMRKSAGSLGKIADGSNSGRRGSTDSAKKTLERDLARGAKEIAKAGVEAIDSVRAHSNSVFDSMSRMVATGLKLAFVGEAIRRVGELNKTYTRLAEVGQTFSGSMMKMSIAAGDAGLPLQEFADLILRNTEAAAELGANGFGQLAVGVRKVAEKQGMYGYSLDQLNEQTGEYLRTARLFGPLERISRGEAIKNFAGLAKQTSVLSQITGKARGEIAQLAGTAMRSALVIGQMYRLEESQRMKSMKTLAEATTFFAAQQGEAGRMLSSLVADTFGAGTSIFTEGGKQFIEAGIGQMAGATDLLNAKIAAKTATDEDYVQYQNELIDTIDANIETLRIQALSGNSAAASMLAMRAEMDKMTMAQIRAKKKQMENTATMTAFITSFESGFKRIIGGVEAGFLKSITPMMDKFTAWLASPDFDRFVDNATDFGVRFGNLISGFFSDTSIDDIMNVSQKLFKGMEALAKVTSNLLDLFIKLTPIVGGFLSMVTALASKFADAVSLVSQVVTKITGSEDTGTAAGAATAALGYGAFQLAKTFFKGFMAGTVTVRGGVVNVIGANGSDLLGAGRWSAAKGAAGKAGKFLSNPRVLAGAIVAGLLAAGAYKLFSSSPAEAKTTTSGGYSASSALSGTGGSPSGRIAALGGDNSGLSMALGAVGVGAVGAGSYKGLMANSGRMAAIMRQSRVTAGASASTGIFDTIKGLAGKSGMKIAGRILPGIGSAYFLYSAYEHLMAGDKVGAAIDLAGAGLSLVPGVGGFVGSVGVGALSAYRDSTNVSGRGNVSPFDLDQEQSSVEPQTSSDTGSSQLDRILAQQERIFDTLATLMARSNALSEENNRLLAKLNNKEQA